MDDGVGRPPPLPPSVVPPPRDPRASTRLYTQGVQAAVRPKEDDGHDQHGGAFSDVSTQSLASCIEHNLDEIQGAEPSAITIADPEMLSLADELTSGLFSRRLRAIARVVIPPVVCSAITLGACWFVWARHPRAGSVMPEVAVVAPVAAAPAPAPAPAPSPAPALAVAPPPAPAPPPAEAPPPAPAKIPEAAPAASEHCRARITSRPSGATVMIGERTLGVTPLETGALPCAGTSFTLVRPRYSSATVALSGSGPAPAALFVKLNRPPAELALSSTPPNAQFKVNRAVVGPAPRSVPVPRYERVHIEASLPGHRKWQKTVYITAASTPINATLAPGR